MAAYGLLRLEQAKQNKTNDSLTLEADTGPREGLLPSQLQPETGAKQELKSQNKVPRSAQGYDVSPSAPSGWMHSLLYGV